LPYIDAERFSEVYNLSGGLKTYETANQKQSNEDIFANDYIGNDDHIYQGNKEKQAAKPIDEGKIKVVMPADCSARVQCLS
jgi:hypothetical protein